MEIGKTIRNLRAESGLSQEQLADKLFVTNWSALQQAEDMA